MYKHRDLQKFIHIHIVLYFTQASAFVAGTLRVLGAKVPLLPLTILDSITSIFSLTCSSAQYLRLLQKNEASKHHQILEKSTVTLVPEMKRKSLVREGSKNAIFFATMS